MTYLILRSIRYQSVWSQIWYQIYTHQNKNVDLRNTGPIGTYCYRCCDNKLETWNPIPIPTASECSRKFLGMKMVHEMGVSGLPTIFVEGRPSHETLLLLIRNDLSSPPWLECVHHTLNTMFCIVLYTIPSSRCIASSALKRFPITGSAHGCRKQSIAKQQHSNSSGPSSKPLPKALPLAEHTWAPIIVHPESMLACGRPSSNSTAAVPVFIIYFFNIIYLNNMYCTFFLSTKKINEFTSLLLVIKKKKSNHGQHRPCKIVLLTLVTPRGVTGLPGIYFMRGINIEHARTFFLLCSRTRYASTWFAYFDSLAFGFSLSHCDHRICISLGWRIRKDTGGTADVVG